MNREVKLSDSHFRRSPLTLVENRLLRRKSAGRERLSGYCTNAGGRAEVGPGGRVVVMGKRQILDVF